MTSAYPPSTLKVNQALAAKDVLMIDAPVSGGVTGAKAGTLSIMVGGDESIFETCRPILSAVGKNLFYMGGIGSGHAVKAINNFLSATSLAATSEAILLAEKFRPFYPAGGRSFAGQHRTQLLYRTQDS